MNRYVKLFVMVVLAGSIIDVQARSLDTKALRKVAERYALPMPPRDARLVLAHTEHWRCVGNGSSSRDPGIYSPAYLLEEKQDGSILILRGARREQLEARENGEPLWRPFSTNKFEPKLGGFVSVFCTMSTFVCAVQTAIMGDEPTAQAIWKRLSTTEEWKDESECEVGDPALLKDQKLLLATCIFNHLQESVIKEKTDWKDVHARMGALLKDFRKLNDELNKDFFEALTRTVNAPPPEPGSVEALLVSWSRNPNRYGRIDFGCGETYDGDAPAREIISRGPSAIPDLIALLDDRRITAHERQAFMNAPACIRCLGELARDVIHEIAGGQLPRDEFKDDRDEIRAWWAKVRNQDELTFLLNGVFSRKDGKITGDKEGPVRIIAAKFPEKLAGLCEEFSKQAMPDATPYCLTEAVAGSSLPKETRVCLLSEFAQRGTLGQKGSVLSALVDLDNKTCAILLLPLLKTLPVDATGKYWICPEARFTTVVIRIEDDNIWREYLRIVKRSSVGLRMQMMEPMGYARNEKKLLNHQFAFLSAFLDDDAVRLITPDAVLFQGPCAGFTIPRLAVRDLAAMLLARLFNMKDSPDEFWTEAQWTELRQRIKERLAKEKLPVL